MAYSVVLAGSAKGQFDTLSRPAQSQLGGAIDGPPRPGGAAMLRVFSSRCAISAMPPALSAMGPYYDLSSIEVSIQQLAFVG